jgi:separase
MVDRVTYLGICELMLAATSVSLRSIELDACIIGALLERQIDGLEGSRWKDGVQNAVGQLLLDVLDVYGPDMPVRRARVLLKCLEFGYHAGPEAVVAIGTPEEMGSEVERLLSQVSYLFPTRPGLSY